jgi:hypothetical protein
MREGWDRGDIKREVVATSGSFKRPCGGGSITQASSPETNLERHEPCALRLGDR